MSSSVPKSVRILVIDDDPSMATLVQGLLTEIPICISSTLSIAQGVQLATEQQFDLIVLDHMLPDGLGLEHIPKMVKRDRLRPILYITAQTSADTAIEAIKQGAFDYLTKPIHFGLLKKRLLEAIEYRQLTRLPVMVESAAENSSDTDVLIGRCRSMQEVYKNIGRLANLPDAALIEGEVGTGKEMIARAIHNHGNRMDAAFVKVSSEELADQLGRPECLSLEQCFPASRGGTLLVEELTAISVTKQAKLLAMLQGARRGEAHLPRLIISTSMPARQLLERGVLRSDLYYFLSPYTIRVPALRERPDDLELLVAHFMQRLANVSSTNQNQGPPRVSAAALALLRQHDWPGNVAQLKSVLQTALHESRGAVLASTALMQALDGGCQREGYDNKDPNESEMHWDLHRFVQDRLTQSTDHLYDDAIAELDRSLLTLVLKHTHGNQAQAAKILGMTRTSLRKKVMASQIDLASLAGNDGLEEDVSEVG